MNEMFHLTSAQTLDDDAHLLCARHLDHLDEFGEDAYRVEVFFVGRFCIFVLLTEYAEYGVWFLSSIRTRFRLSFLPTTIGVMLVGKLQYLACRG